MAKEPGLSFKTPGQYNRKQNINLIRRIYDENTKSKAFDRAMKIAIQIYKLREEITNRTDEEFLGKLLGAKKELHKQKGFGFRQKHLNTSLKKFKDKVENDG